MRNASASLLFAPIAILLLFLPNLLGWDRLAFRDVSHFYTPLYDYVAQRQAEAWIPLWNPLDHTGLPLLGETTTAVLYPLRWLIYSLPLASATAMSWYVVTHLLIAAFAAWKCARWSGVSRPGAGIASMIYPLGGSVLFLYSNPPFLVGAAWLPLVLGALIGKQGPGSRFRVLIAAVSLALMILGGDPQTAFHAMLVATAILIVRRVRAEDSPVDFRGLVRVALSAAVLSLPQIAASVDWSMQSDRIGSSDAGLLAPPVVGSRQHQAFQFSLPPWHAIELATPMPYGSLFPENHRVSRLIPGDGRTWTPSIYVGLVAGICLLLRFWNWRRRGIDAWTAIAVFALLCTLGHFGLAWTIQTTTGWLDFIDSAAGGPYWILYQFLPGYDSFRYPAKWLTIFSLAISIATAKWLDQPSNWIGLGRCSSGLIFVFGLGALVAWIYRLSLVLVGEPSLPASTRDEFWGPLQTIPALDEITKSLIHSLLIAGLLTYGLRLGFRKRWSPSMLQWGLLVLLSVDMTLAARAILLDVPVSVESRLLVASSDDSSGDASGRWMRTQTGDGWPTSWQEKSSPHRPVEVESSGRSARFGRWHLAGDEAMFNSMTSIRSRNLSRFWTATRELTKSQPAERRTAFWNALMDWLDIDVITHASSRGKPVMMAGEEFEVADVSVTRRTDGQPRLWAYQHWTVADRELPRSIMTQQLSQIAWGTKPATPLVHQHGDGRPTSSANSKLLPPQAIPYEADDAERLTFQVENAFPRLIVRSEYQDGNWRGRYRPTEGGPWKAVGVFQVDFLKQGAVLPAGSWEVEFVYAPWWLAGSVSLSLLGWFVTAILTYQYRND